MKFIVFKVQDLSLREASVFCGGFRAERQNPEI
jgi:hypothetical protein